MTTLLILANRPRSDPIFQTDYFSAIFDNLYCNVAEFSSLLSRYRERIYVMKSHLFGRQEENPSPKRQDHSYSCIIYLFLLVFFFFMREKIMRRA